MTEWDSKFWGNWRDSERQQESRPAALGADMLCNVPAVVAALEGKPTGSTRSQDPAIDAAAADAVGAVRATEEASSSTAASGVGLARLLLKMRARSVWPAKLLLWDCRTAEQAVKGADIEAAQAKFRTGSSGQTKRLRRQQCAVCSSRVRKQSTSEPPGPRICGRAAWQRSASACGSGTW